jgi:hypothetical protein
MEDWAVEAIKNALLDSTIERAGLGKGTTVVDNDLIANAFEVGAGLAAGFVGGAAEFDEEQLVSVAAQLKAFLDACIQRAEIK